MQNLLIRVPFKNIMILISGVLVALESLKNPNKVHHLMQPKHGFKPDICEIDCIKQSLAGGVQGREGEELKHRGYCKHGCIIETPGKIVNNRFNIGTSYHITPCKA